MKRSDTPLTDFDKETYEKDPLAIWVWRASPGACITCRAMDGRKYTYDAVPSRPHPNCNCTVEVMSSVQQRDQQGGGFRDTVRDVSEWSRKIAKDKGDRILAEYKSRYEKKEGKGWSMIMFDLFPSETTPFAIKLLQQDVQSGLREKAVEYSNYPNWAQEFLIQANSYSYTAATIDNWYYGAKTDKIVRDIERKVKQLDSGRH